MGNRGNQESVATTSISKLVVGSDKLERYKGELEEIQAIFEEFFNEGTLKTASSKARGGVTGEVKVTPGSKLKPQQFVSILHAKIAALRWTKDMATHLNARDAFPDEIPIRGFGKRRKTKEEKEAVENAEIDLKGTIHKQHWQFF